MVPEKIVYWLYGLEWFTCAAHCAGLSSIPCNCW